MSRTFRNVRQGDLFVSGCSVCITGQFIVLLLLYLVTALSSLLIHVFGTDVRNAGPVIDVRRSVSGADLVKGDDL